METGANINGFDHVLQCIGDFFTTRFGERFMREWYGTIIPAFLGQQLNSNTVVKFWAAVCSAIEQWEPRYRITKITPLSVGRDGKLRIQLEGQYRPRALLGDFSPEGARRVTIFGGTGAAFEVQNGD